MLHEDHDHNEIVSPSPRRRNFLQDNNSDADTASQRSISLSSPPLSARNSATFTTTPLSPIQVEDKRLSRPYTLDTDASSEVEESSVYTRDSDTKESPDTSAAPSVFEQDTLASHSSEPDLPTYPPKSFSQTDAESVTSFTSGSSKKARPESMLALPTSGPIVLGIALVDFNHLVGPKVEYSKGDIFDDEEVVKILPFLALPDGAHLSSEDFSYFHVVPSGPKPTTVFGISCNRQIAASSLLVKDPDVTRSTVQKAVVVLASKPVFGPIRDKLGVITQALFNQRDFTTVDILDDFGASLESSLRSQMTESGLYMGTSLRELVHTFRQRTLVLVKALMIQKRLMFYGHPVERLCTYQYSLISLFPGLLQSLEDCGSPPLNARAASLSAPTSLRTSDRKSLMAYIGLPLDIFGKDAFFQPYLPLQQLDMIKDTQSWLCGSTNSIVTQQKEVDILVNTETGTIEFRNPLIERSAGLTAADRKWMDDIVKDVNDGWDDGKVASGIQFKGSDDYLRTKFEEYISAALAAVKYQSFLTKGGGSGVLITGGTGSDLSSVDDFNPLWLADFKRTHAHQVWEGITDPLLFDIVEPRHPCNEKPSVVADLGLRISEGIQDLKLEQQLGPAREAVSRTLATGSTNFFKAVEGVRGRWAQRNASSSNAINANDTSSNASGSPVEVTKADWQETPAQTASTPSLTTRFSFLSRRSSSGSVNSTQPASTVPTSPPPTTAAATTLSSWGAGIGSLWSSRTQQSTAPSHGAKSSESSATLPPIPSSPPPTLQTSNAAAGSAHGTVNSPISLSPDEMKTPSKSTFASNSQMPNSQVNSSRSSISSYDGQQGMAL